MAKVTIKAECITQNNTANGSNATFVVKNNVAAAPGTPGQPPRVSVKRAVTLNFDDDTAKQYVPGKTYTITIE
jgi:hypothetical protein